MRARFQNNGFFLSLCFCGLGDALWITVTHDHQSKITTTSARKVQIAPAGMMRVCATKGVYKPMRKTPIMR
jgi:hypothetical protein